MLIPTYIPFLLFQIFSIIVRDGVKISYFYPFVSVYVFLLMLAVEVSFCVFYNLEYNKIVARDKLEFKDVDGYSGSILARRKNKSINDAWNV